VGIWRIAGSDDRLLGRSAHPDTERHQRHCPAVPSKFAEVAGVHQLEQEFEGHVAGHSGGGGADTQGSPVKAGGAV